MCAALLPLPLNVWAQIQIVFIIQKTSCGIRRETHLIMIHCKSNKREVCNTGHLGQWDMSHALGEMESEELGHISNAHDTQ